MKKITRAIVRRFKALIKNLSASKAKIDIVGYLLLLQKVIIKMCSSISTMKPIFVFAS